MNQSVRQNLNAAKSDCARGLQQSRLTGFQTANSRLGDYLVRGLLVCSTLIAQIPLMLATAQPAFANSDVCATPGKDGVANVNNVVNTYFVGGAPGEIANPGQKTINLPSSHSNGANVSITPGDMLMIIQMQDATIDSSNTASYGSGSAANDGSGATDIGNSGIYEFVRATNTVPITGGILEFEAGGVGGGLIHRYVNAAPNATRGRRTFQIVRVPQYASLTLQGDLTVPDWDGTSGGVLAIDVAGGMDFNGFIIDVTDKGFRGGYTLAASSGINIADYVYSSGTTQGGGKGEGIAGTPRFTWNGITTEDLGSDQLPGGDDGRGAPGNAGGGGNDHNAGGGGGGNGGQGGTGGIGWEGAGFRSPANNTTNTPGGRGGAIPAAPTITRLFMGGGGGGGDANNETNGVRGGQGGGVVMIRAGEFVGSGTIRVNGSEGEEGESDGAPDGAGGGGAGGTVAIIAESGSLTRITVEAVGGDGGNTINDGGSHTPHGPGGAGAGGVVMSYSPGGQIISGNVSGGENGRTDSGNGIAHGTESGDGGLITLAFPDDIPPILSGAECFPQLEVTKTEANPGEAGERIAPNTANYTITVTNTGNGGAAGVKIKDSLPTGFTYSSGATAVLAGGATGTASPNNTGTAASPEFGDYVIPSGGSVTINFAADIAGNTPLGVYQNPAYATYLDPSRITPGRRITPLQGAESGDNTTYEGGVNAGQIIPGTNYIATSSGGENVHITSTDPVSSLAGTIMINEVMFRQTGGSAIANDEFIELYNAGDAAVDLTGWQLIDGNLLIGDTDSANGSINGSNNNGAFVFPNGTILNPDEYAVVWVGSATASKDATNAAHQFYLGNNRRLNNNGEDVWLYDASTRIVDYIAYGSGHAINTPPDPALNLWNITVQSIAAQSSLINVSAGQSISLTPNGQDGNDSRCWEPTTSEEAESRCTNYLLTRDTDNVGSRITSVGRNNNGARLFLVKRITNLIPNRDNIDFNSFIEDGVANNEDNHPFWPSDTDTYLRGQPDGLTVAPDDEIEYTVYFLSNGGQPAQNVQLCDVIPEHTTLVEDTYGSDRSIALGLNNNILPTVPNFELTNFIGDDRGEFYAPGTAPPSECKKHDPLNPNNLIPVNAGNNNSGAVVVELTDSLPPATSAGTPSNAYGFFRFRVQVE